MTRTRQRKGHLPGAALAALFFGAIFELAWRWINRKRPYVPMHLYPVTPAPWDSSYPGYTPSSHRGGGEAI